MNSLQLRHCFLLLFFGINPYDLSFISYILLTFVIHRTSLNPWGLIELTINTRKNLYSILTLSMLAMKLDV